MRNRDDEVKLSDEEDEETDEGSDGKDEVEDVEDKVEDVEDEEVTDVAAADPPVEPPANRKRGRRIVESDDKDDSPVCHDPHCDSTIIINDKDLLRCDSPGCYLTVRLSELICVHY